MPVFLSHHSPEAQPIAIYEFQKYILLLRCMLLPQVGHKSYFATVTRAASTNMKRPALTVLCIQRWDAHLQAAKPSCHSQGPEQQRWYQVQVSLVLTQHPIHNDGLNLWPNACKNVRCCQYPHPSGINVAGSHGKIHFSSQNKMKFACNS